MAAGGKQEVGWDQMGSEWRREKKTGSSWDKQSEPARIITQVLPSFVMWTTLLSKYREAVCLPAFLTLNQPEIIDDIEIEAYVSYEACHGSPRNVDIQRREENQVGRFSRTLSRLK
jgi:hypothetical protein